MSQPTPDQQPGGGRFVVVTQDGMGVTPAEPGSDPEGAVERNPAELVEQPAKVMRIGSMIKQLLDEVRSAPLDEAGRARLRQIHERSLVELEEGLAPELVAELRRIAPPFVEGDTPSDSELRIAQAQLVGWLEGLFHGIQTALFAQQMAARGRPDQMRALPPALGSRGPAGQEPPTEGGGHGTGQYL